MLNTKKLQEIYLTTGKKVFVPRTFSDELRLIVSDKKVIAFVLNLQSLGFMLSSDLLKEIKTMSDDDFDKFSSEVHSILVEYYGTRENMRPMYDNHFVNGLETDEVVLYTNAFMHYLTNGEWTPEYKNLVKFPQEKLLELKTIDLGTIKDLSEYIFTIANSPVSLSNQQKDNLLYLIKNLHKKIDDKDFIDKLNMPNKENMVYTLRLLLDLKRDEVFLKVANTHIKTSTDVLRLAVNFAQGDYTLASRQNRLVSIKRPVRRMLLNILNKVVTENKQALEDASVHQNLWVIVAEKLHPGDYANRYPAAMKFIDEIRNSKVRSWYSKVEKAYETKDLNEIINLLSKRPGEFARRLERTLRLAIDTQQNPLLVLEAFDKISDKLPSTLLLQLGAYFKDMDNKDINVRSFVPKGNVNRVYVKEDTREKLNPLLSEAVANACDKALIAKFKKKESLGKVYIEKDKLNGYALPLKLRTASKQLMTLPRGSRVKLPEEAEFLRMFVYWRNKKERTDIDLSAVVLDKSFNVISEEIYYCNLVNEEYKIVHSGDFVSAKEGAAEFIDVQIDALKSNEAKYVVMAINSFTSEAFCDLEECFAGISVISKDDVIKFRNKVTYDPVNAVIRSDVSVNATFCSVLAYDVETHEIIWLDTVTSRDYYNGMVYDNSGKNIVNTSCSFVNAVRGMINASYPQFSHLIDLHLKAREHEIVDTPEEADIIISLDKGLTPYSAEEINANWI